MIAKQKNKNVWGVAIKKTCLVRDGKRRQVAFIDLYNVVMQCQRHVWLKAKDK